jgi:TonB family protein
MRERRVTFGLAWAMVGAVGCTSSTSAVAPPSTGGPQALLATLDLPRSTNASVWVADDAPLVTVSGDTIKLDGAVVGDPRPIAAAGTLHFVNDLAASLKADRERWRRAHPGAGFPGVASLACDRATPGAVVKSVFQTAAFAGYSKVQLVTRATDGSLATLPAEAWVPRPPAPSIPPRPVPRLVVEATPARVTLIWRDHAVAAAPHEVPSAAVADAVRTDWASHASSRDGHDRELAVARVSTSNEVDCGGTVALLDALAGPRREAGDGGPAGHAGHAAALSVTWLMGAPSGSLREGTVMTNGEGLGPSAIRSVMVAHGGAFRGCYQAALARDATLRGMVRLRFHIGADGRVTSADVDSASTLQDFEASSCMVSVVNSLVFPPSGAPSDVRFPLSFAP